MLNSCSNEFQYLQKFNRERESEGKDVKFEKSLEQMLHLSKCDLGLQARSLAGD